MTGQGTPITKKIPKQELLDQYMPYEPPKGGKIIRDTIVDHTRWSVIHELIVQFPDDPEDVAWSTDYSVGATESQYESPWEYQDSVTLTMVKKVTRTMEVWVVVREDG